MPIPELFPILLEECCLATTDQIFNEILPSHGFTTVTTHQNRRYALREGIRTTSPMLLCHADTVRNGGAGPHNFAIKGSKVTSLALDDRLGLAILLWSIYKLPDTLGNCAMLVCDEEECGRSSAQVFSSDTVKPNWLMEFDRRGTDVVCYRYESDLFTSLIKHAGFERVGNGTVSDISHLDLGVVGMNVGVGYHQEHSESCHVDLVDTYTQMRHAINFYKLFEGIRMEWKTRYGGYSSYGSYKSTAPSNSYDNHYGYYGKGSYSKKDGSASANASRSAEDDFDILNDPFKAGSHDHILDDDDAYEEYWRRRGYDDTTSLDEWRAKERAKWQDVDDDEDTVVVDESEIRKLISDQADDDADESAYRPHVDKFQGCADEDIVVADMLENFHWEGDMLIIEDTPEPTGKDA